MTVSQEWQEVGFANEIVENTAKTLRWQKPSFSFRNPLLYPTEL
jgi:hypothetical protein